MDRRTQQLLNDPKVNHGVRYTYTKLKCRCDKCREANAQYKRNKTAYYARLQASQVRQSISPATQDFLDSLTHGIPSTYEWYQCRCEECKQAKARVSSSRRIALVLAS